MRVVLFTDSDVFAGTERHILDLARGLVALGVEVQIGCPEPSALHEKASFYGIGVVSIQKKGAIDLAAVMKLSRLLKDGAIDIIHSHNGRTAFSAAIAKRLARRGACVATQHFLQPHRVSRRGPASLISRIAHRWTSRETDHFLAISNAARSGMLERGDAQRDKISVVHNGIADPLSESPRQSEIIRCELGVGANSTLIVCAARLEAEKNIGALVAAMERVRVFDSSVCCAIAGEGSLEKELRAQVSAAGLENCVRLLGFRPDTIALINACDLFVLPSVAEPFGLVILEAMALGKAVVATAAGGPKEIIVQGETGLLVEPLSVEALAEAVCGMIARPVERARFGSEGRKRFEANFTAARMAEETLEVYRETLWQSSNGDAATTTRISGGISVVGVG